MISRFTERVEEIFCAALEIASARKRTAYLDANCGSNPELRAAVERMLSSQPAAEGFFGDTQLALARARTDVHSHLDDELGAVDENEGLQIGPYKLLQGIGEGGCGVVYMAEQQTPIRRRVALKIIKLGMDTKRVIARFEAERQALALMDHPNIARVLDAGATQTGRPFFVMELVRGVKITKYCDEHCLDARQRLGLFIQVCHAVQHAHQKGVIHRDIKPSNILVTSHDGFPVPKVIDFGIAKAIVGQVLTEKTLFTAYEQFLGTPAYMSPEQAEMSNLDVDTRSDIYSLGVLLYELLTGKTPFDQDELLKSGLDEMRRTLRETEPSRPSAKLDGLPFNELTETALQRRVEPRELKCLLTGDLDWVVMKALEKDRALRYQTANGLASEVQRHLNHEPVTACPPSQLYRFRKLVRRNKVVFICVGVVSLTLATGFGTSSWLFVKEREALRQQALLREEAERSRANETRLRLDAEATAKATYAAILIHRGNVEEADRLVEQIQVPLTQLSLEAASVFRTLGKWNVLHGQWKKASDRYLKLANQIEKTDRTDIAARDLLNIAPTLIVAGEIAGYHRLVEETVSRFGKADDPTAAEEILRVSTLLPPEAGLLQQLVPLANVVESALVDEKASQNDRASALARQALTMSLYSYRCANFPAALEWGQRCLGYADNTTNQVAMAKAIVGVAAHRMNPADGYSDYQDARSIVDSRFRNSSNLSDGLSADASEYWQGWIMAWLFCREADREMHPERH